jgi:exopolyphosphatase/guanosine-5'-triphosphate,3'-diphosphate pyrophosphatase
MIRAVLDIGSNSVKLLAARILRGRLVPVLERSAVTRLGEGLDRSGRISPEAEQRTAKAIRGFVKAARDAGAVDVVAVGTLALRRARNGRATAKRLERASGLPIRILSGEEEAAYAFRAAAGRGRTTSLDIGGGSAQVTAGRGGRVERSWSFPLGAVVLTERFHRSDPVRLSEILALTRHLDRTLKPLDGLRCRELVGIGGTVGVLAGLLGPARSIPYRRLLRLFGRLATMKTERRERLGIPKGRADIVLAGAQVLLSVMKRLGATRLRQASGGLRHGVLKSLFRT